jgi:DNA-binding response OmpR family regulator
MDAAGIAIQSHNVDVRLQTSNEAIRRVSCEFHAADHFGQATVMNNKILVVEDDAEMVRVLRQGLEQEEYRVMVAQTGPQGLDMAGRGGFGVIILDVMLPALDGYSFARSIRSTGDCTPILMLTALDAVPDIVTGLDAGADDYLAKPFSFPELLARLRSLLRRGLAPARSLMLCDLEMDTASHTVTRGGEGILLTKTEYLLLEVLMRNAGHVVSREEMVKAVWGKPSAIEQSGIDSYIKALRDKIDQPSAVKLIQTVRGFGYKLTPH